MIILAELIRLINLEPSSLSRDHMLTLWLASFNNIILHLTFMDRLIGNRWHLHLVSSIDCRILSLSPIIKSLMEFWS